MPGARGSRIRFLCLTRRGVAIHLLHLSEMRPLNSYVAVVRFPPGRLPLSN